MRLTPDKDSVEYFGSFYQLLHGDSEETIVCDLCAYQYIHPSYAVLIASSISVGKMLGKRVIIRYNRRNTEAVSFLGRSGMISTDTLNQNTILDENNLPIRRFFKLEDTFDTIQHILKCAPVQLEDQLSNTLISKIGEIFSNAFTHSRSQIGVFCCGLVDQSSRFTFSVYDAGVGIPENVSQYLGKPISPSEALKWAFTQGNSTLNGKKDYPRGAGLNLLESFVRVNGGRIDLVSCGGYCHIDSSQREFFDVSRPFIGTMFSMTILADNNHIYQLG